ncbi:hypothetical protein PVAP13_4KG265700 [Panicum virgatum]|uniref:Uncharacterized protein n=1 Tax=Panicum virgatum TaxID=38727 RepID=A0A8T0TWI8_PANVG|nr:hypothetical protein PVAP13_4KG265700 [Panicum virgatum]
MAAVKSNAVRSLCAALCIILMMSSALSAWVEDHTECDAMKSCTDAKCEQECQNKSTNLPIEPECTTPNECCCTFYREEHNVLHP